MARDRASRTGTATMGRIVDGTLAVVAATAVAAGYLGGMPWRGLGLLVLVSVGLEYALSNAVTGDLIESVDGDPGLVSFDPERYARDGAETATESDRYATLCSVVSSVRRDLAVGPVAVTVDPDGDSGVTILGGDSRTVLLVSGSVLDRLDESALRGVVAHELAHVSRGHLNRSPLGPAVAHVVGVVTLWLVALHATAPAVTAVLAGSYLTAGVSRRGGPVRLWYVAGSLGLVLVPLALSAAASRLQEYEADDVAVAYTSPVAFCTGLYLVTKGSLGSGDDLGGVGGVGAETPAADRGFLDRLTAPYPAVERRFARQGLDPTTVAERAGDARERPAAARVDADGEFTD